MSRIEEAKAILVLEDATASALYMSALIFFGEDFDDVEPECLRITASRAGVTIPEAHWDCLFAINAMRGDSRFMWDALTFSNTMLALNGIDVIPDVVQQASPDEIAWGMSEAVVLCRDLIPEGTTVDEFLDHEPVSYTAVSCKHDGFMITPDELDYAYERLIGMIDSSHAAMQSKVKESWLAVRDAVNDESVLELTDDDAVTQQVRQLAQVKNYVQHMTLKRATQLDRLGLHA